MSVAISYSYTLQVSCHSARGCQRRRPGRHGTAPVCNVMVASRQRHVAPRVGSALQPFSSVLARREYLYKSWAMCASFESIAQLASTCNHPPGSPSTIAGKKVGDKYLSELAAEYPPSLAQGLAQLFLPYVTRHSIQNASIADFANMLPETYVPRRL